MASTGIALWPGSSTFPNTNVYPGQGTLPIVRVQISPDDASDPVPTWTNYESRLRAFSVSRGRGSELSEFDAGTATVTLDNRDRAFDPSVVNLITNPIFNGGDTSGWDTSSSWFLNAGGVQSITTSGPLYGAQALQVTTDAVSTQEGVRFQPIPVVAGTSYTFSCYVWLNSGNASMRIGLGASGIGSNDVAFTATGSWNRFSVTTTASSNGNMQAALYGSTAAVRNFQIDGAQVQEGSTATPFITGLVRPLNRLRLYAEHAGTVYEMFRGYAESYSFAWDPSGIVDATATMNAVDEFKVLSESALPVTNPPRESYADLIASDLAVGYWEMSDDPLSRSRIPVEVAESVYIPIRQGIITIERGDRRVRPRKPRKR